MPVTRARKWFLFLWTRIWSCNISLASTSRQKSRALPGLFADGCIRDGNEGHDVHQERHYQSDSKNGSDHQISSFYAFNGDAKSTSTSQWFDSSLRFLLSSPLIQFRRERFGYFFELSGTQKVLSFLINIHLFSLQSPCSSPALFILSWSHFPFSVMV